ncbi:MAG: hypothetical protein KDD82_25585 [Planctomycetes bacterium]|nr:hypothetical protein [Planctomycetota bacterium]
MAKRRRKQKPKRKDAPVEQAQVAEAAAPDARPAWFRRMAADLSGTGTALYLLFVLAVAVFTYSIFVPFLFDDAPVVTRNQHLWNPWNDPATWIELTKLNVNRCLVNFTFYFNFNLAGTPTTHPYEPAVAFTWSYHVVSIAFHALNGLLLFLLVRGLLLARSEVRPGLEHWVALAAAGLWLVHPVHVMAVSYIAQRYAVMGASAFLGACVCYTYARLQASRDPERPAYGLWAGTLLCVTACAVTKENTLVIPGALFLIELGFFKGKRWWAPAVCMAPFMLGGLVLLGYYGPAKLAGLWFPAKSAAGATRFEYFTSQIYITLRYLNQFLLPIDQTVEHGFPHSVETGWPHKGLDVAFAFLGHALIWVLGLKLLLRGHRLIPLAIGWYYLTHVVESSFIPILDLMVDHRLYLPSALLPAAFVVAWARYYPELEEAEPRTRVLMPVAFTLLGLVLAAGTVARIHTWTSSTGIWEDTIAKRPSCARAYSSLGMEHLYREEWLEAVGPIEASLQLGAVHVEGWNNLGNAYLNLKDWRSAEYALLNGIRVHQLSPSASVRFCWNNVGLVYRNMAFKGDPQLTPEQNKLREKKLIQEAAYRFRQAIQVAASMNRHYGVAWMNLIDAESALRKLADTPQERTEHAKAVVEALRDYVEVSIRQKLPPAATSLMHALEAYLALGRTAEGMQAVERLGFPYNPPQRLDLREAYARAALAAAMVGDPGARELLAHAHEVLAGEQQRFDELAARDPGVDAALGARLLLLRILLAEALGEQQATEALTQQALALDPKLGEELAKLRQTFRPK